MCEEKSGGLLKMSRLIIGGGCLNEALNWSVKGFGGLTYSPNRLLEVSPKSQLRLVLIFIILHLLF